MATRQPNDSLEIRDWMTELFDLLRRVHEIRSPEEEKRVIVEQVLKLVTTFNAEWFAEWFQNPAMISITKSLSADQKSEILRRFLLDIITRSQEDAEDVAAMEEAMKEPGPGIPWEKVKKELGI